MILPSKRQPPPNRSVVIQGAVLLGLWLLFSGQYDVFHISAGVFSVALIMLLNRGQYKGKRILSERAVSTMLSNQSGCLPILRHAYDSLDVIDPALAKAPYGIGC